MSKSFKTDKSSEPFRTHCVDVGEILPIIIKTQNRDNTLMKGAVLVCVIEKERVCYDLYEIRKSDVIVRRGNRHIDASKDISGFLYKNLIIKIMYK